VFRADLVASASYSGLVVQPICLHRDRPLRKGLRASLAPCSISVVQTDTKLVFGFIDTRRQGHLETHEGPWNRRSDQRLRSSFPPSLLFVFGLQADTGIDWSARRHVPHLGSLHRRYPLCRLRISLPPLYVFSPSLTPLQSSRSNSPLSSSLISSYA
jgi:hypothetical protein